METENNLKNIDMVMPVGAPCKKRGRKPMTDEERAARRIVLAEYNREYYKHYYPENRTRIIERAKSAYQRHKDDVIPDEVKEGRRVAHLNRMVQYNKKAYQKRKTLNTSTENSPQNNESI